MHGGHADADLVKERDLLGEGIQVVGA